MFDVFTTRRVIVGSIVVFFGYLLIVWIGVAGARWANRVSEKCEQKYTDAVIRMQENQ